MVTKREPEALDMESVKTLVGAAWEALYITSDLNDNHTAEDLAFVNQQINGAFAALSRLRNMVGQVDGKGYGAPEPIYPPVSGGSPEMDSDETACGALCQELNDRMWAELGPVDDVELPF